MKNLSLPSIFIGTGIEVFDHSIFAYLIPVLSEVFFPNESTQVAVNFTLLAFLVSYAVKPFSSIFFGYVADFYGRRKVLLVTTFLMAISTTILGLLPTNLPVIYIWLLVIICRIIQGFSIAGEFSNGIIMAVEQGSKRPAFSGSIVFMGGILGLIFANGTVFILINKIPHDQIITHAWRIPFLISAVIWLIVFGMRSQIAEPVISQRILKGGIIKLAMAYKKELLVIFLVTSLSASAFYITFVFMPMYISSVLKVHEHSTAMQITLICLLLYFATLPFFASLADKSVLLKQIKRAAFLYLLFSYVIFLSLPKASYIGVLFGLLFFTLLQAYLNSALPAFMVSLFPGKFRGRALAISYNSGLTLFGGLMPYLVLTKNLSISPGILISICAVMSLLVLHLLRKE